MKIKNYTIFNSNLTKNWDELRNSNSYENYFIPQNKEDYLNNLKKYNINKRLEVDLSLSIKKHSIDKIFSLCSGSCYLEYFLMKKHKLKCCVSDSTESIHRIKKFNIFNSATIIDVTKPFNFKVEDNTLLLLSRIDTEFDDNEMKTIFNNLSDLGVKLIYFIPAEILTIKTFLIKIKIIFKCLLEFRKPISWGYVRSYRSFEKLWKKYYETKTKNFFGLTLLRND